MTPEPIAAGSALHTARSIARATERALEQLRTVEQELEASLRSRVEDYGRALQTAFDELQQHHRASTAELATPVEALPSAVRAWLEQARRELSQQVEETRQALHTELERVRAELLEVARRQTEELVDRLADQLAAGSQRQLSQQIEVYTTQAHQRILGAIATLDEAVQQTLGRLQSAEQQVSAKLQRQVEHYQRLLSETVDQAGGTANALGTLGELATQLERNAAEHLEQARARLQEELDHAVAVAHHRLNELGDSLIASVERSLESVVAAQQQRLQALLDREAQSATALVSQSAEQVTAQLESARQAAIANFQQKLEEHVRQVTDTVAAELRARQLDAALVAQATEGIETAAHQILDRAVAQLEQKVQATLATLTQQVHTLRDELVEQIRNELDSRSVHWVEEIGESLRAQQATRLSQWLDEQTQTARRAAQSASEGIARLTEQALARIESASQQAEAAFREQIAAEQRQLIESVFAELGRGELHDQLLAYATEELRRASAALADQAVAELAHRARAAQEAFSTELQAAAQQTRKELEASLSALSEQQRSQLRQWWEERQQLARQQAEAVARLLEQTAEEAAEKLRTTQANVQAELRQYLQAQRKEFAQQVLAELHRSEALQPVVQETTKQIQLTAREIIQRSLRELESELNAVKATLHQQAQDARQTLSHEMTRLTDQAQHSLRTAGKTMVEDYRRQLERWWEEQAQSARRQAAEAAQALSRLSEQASERLRTMLREMEAETGQLFQNFRQELRQLAAEEIRRHGFQEEALTLIAGELDRTAHELAAQTTHELQKHIEASLTGLREQLRVARDGFLEETQRHLAELTKTALQSADSHLQELLTHNVQQLEHEQEQWLQRRREIIWQEINQLATPAAAAAPTQAPRAARSGRAAKETGKRRASVASVAAGAIGVVALAGLLTFAFVNLFPKPTETVQLRSDPPASFLEVRPEWNPRQRAHQEQLARAYWKIAITTLESKYAYGTPLPEQPPPEFQVNENGLKDDPATRSYYWDKLRQIWLDPTSWTSANPSSTSWLASLLDRFRSMMPKKQTTLFR